MYCLASTQSTNICCCYITYFSSQLFAVVYMGILVAVVVYALLWYFMKWFEILKNKYEGGTSTEPTDYEQD